VRGSVRSLDKAEKVRHALGEAGGDVGRLEFVALDLLDDAGWDAAMEGVRFVQHTASPFVLEIPRDPDLLIRPAVEGTERAMRAALAAGVERIVLTSSIASIQYGHADYDRLLTEADWSDTENVRTGPYARSKTLAERAAWRLAEEAGRRDALAVINPAVILGPLLDDDPGTSAVIIKRLINGSLPAMPRIGLALTVVRDVAELHVDAMTRPEAGGERCIVSEGSYRMAEMAAVLREAFPYRRIPRHELPDWLVRIAARFDRDIRDNLEEMGVLKRLDAARAESRLGRPLTPAGQSIRDTAESLIARGLA